MSRCKDFVIVRAGTTGSWVVRQFLNDKAAGTINEVVVLTRQESNTTIDGDTRVIPIDYSDKESIQYALAGIDVVISTLPDMALGLQPGISEAAKEAGVKLFVPSEIGEQQKDIWRKGWHSCIFFGTSVYRGAGSLVSTSQAGNYRSVAAATRRFRSPRGPVSRDIYLSNVLTHLPAEQLNNRSFTIAGDINSFNEIFKEYEAKTGKKLEVTYIPVLDLNARLATNPQDFSA